MTDRDIFINAPADLTGEELDAYLAEACGGDADLEKRARKLFDSARKAPKFLECVPLEDAATAPGRLKDPLAEPGVVIGNYKLLQRIGEGGFGVVYMAEQLRPVKRRVALKIIKLGMDTKQVVARFEAERQALAMMDHPNIAKVHDAGATETGRPYFVMELVRGIPITDYCDANNLSTEERLDLFIAVCQAVQHAHQKGVIHRDLKPSNVMITLHDDKAVPKVIDFGVAKATQQELTDKTLFTQYEQFIGTPAYMSPEQAQMSGLDIDTRSDIYSLGVLLYELLTGTTPFDAKELAKAGMDEVRRVIREEEPPRPSLRLSTMKGAARIHLAKHRKAVPDKLPGLLRGDLDWIIMKALEKDRTRRYETANGLAEDIRRHLADEPVSAGAPSAAYRAWKYARRHRAGLSVAAIIAFLLVAGTVVSTWLAIERKRTAGELADQLTETKEARNEAKSAQIEAETAKVKADRSAREMAFLLADEDPVRGTLALARRLRNNQADRVSAGRVMSSLWQTTGTMPLSPPLQGEHAALTEDGRFIALGNEVDKSTLRIVDAETGQEVASKQCDCPILGVGFSSDPHQRRIVTLGLKLPERHGLVEVWDWKDEKGVRLAEPVRVGCFLHNDFVAFAHLSPDGTMVLTGGQGPGNSRGLVWKIESGELRTVDSATKVGTADNHNTLTGCWSPDGTRVATAGTPLGSWRIDTIHEGKVVGAPVTNRGESQKPGIKSIRFSPDGKWVVTGSHDGTAQVWDASTGKAVGQRLVHGGVVSYAEFNPQDGGQVLTASLDGKVRLWEAETGEPLLSPFVHPGGVEEAHFSPDGWLVVSDCEDNRIRIWSTITGNLIEERDGVIREIFRVGLGGRFADGGRKVLAWTGGGGSRGRRVWPLLGGKALRQEFRHIAPTAWVHPGRIFSADFHPTDSQLVSVSREQLVRGWSRESGELMWSRPIPTQAVKRTVKFSPDGMSLLVATDDEGLCVSRLLPTARWGLPVTLVDHAGTDEEQRIDRHALIPHAEFSPPQDSGSGVLRSRWIVSANFVGKKAQVWDAETGESKATLTRDGLCNFASFSHDATRVVTTGVGGWAQIWEGLWEAGQESVRKIVEFKAAGGEAAVAFFHPTDRNRVLCASEGGKNATIWIVDPTTNEAKRVRELPHDQGVGYAEWSPNGSRVVTASYDGRAQVWDAESGARIGVALQHGDWVVRAEFSPDGRRVVTASRDGTARVWDAESGFPLCAPLDHQSPVNFARFSPDGRQVVTTGDDSTVRLWDLPPLPDGPVPEWVPGWIEAVIGLRLEDGGSVTSVSEEERKKARAEVASRSPDDYYARVAQWFYSDRRTRPITPFSQVTIERYVANRIRENTQRSLEEALMVDPGNPAALMALAQILADGPVGDTSNLRRAAAQVRRLARDGDDRPDLEDLTENIDRKRRYAKVLERIEGLKQQAAAMSEAGNLEAAESIVGTAILGWVLCESEYGEPSLSRTMEARFPMLRAILDARHGPRILISPGSRWRFPAEVGNPGDGWVTNLYDDSPWREGMAPLGFSPEGEDGEKTVLTGDDGAITYFFRHTFEWEGGAFAADDLRSLVLWIRCDDGAVVHLNGVEVQRVNMPEGEIGRDTQAVTTRSADQERRWTLHLLDRSALRKGTNVLAVEVHQRHGERKPSSDLMLDLELKLQQITPVFLRSLLRAAGGSDDVFDRLAHALPEEVTPRNRMRWKMALAEEMPPGLEREDLRFRVRVQALLSCWDGALEAIDEALAQQGESFEPAEVRRRKDLLRAEFDILTAAQRSKEAEVVRAEILGRPPRDPALSPKLINLDEAKADPGVYRGFFTLQAPGRNSEQYWRERFAERFPVERKEPVNFDIRGRIALNSGPFERGLPGVPGSRGKDFQEATGKSEQRPWAIDRPDSVEIPVNQKAEKLHFLQWCDYSEEPDGTLVAHYVVHYADGTPPERIPVVYGKDVADLDIELDSLPPERIAWEHRYKHGNYPDSRIALGIQTWENPHPEKEISHVDFVSAKVQAVPVLVAMTAE